MNNTLNMQTKYGQNTIIYHNTLSLNTYGLKKYFFYQIAITKELTHLGSSCFGY